MSGNNNKPTTKNATVKADANPELRLAVAQIILELYAREEFVLDIDDGALATKYAKRVKALEDRIAELETRAGVPATAERVDAAALATTSPEPVAKATKGKANK